MMGFLTRQLREIIALVEAMGRRVATSVALLIVALILLLASFAFLSVALYLWVADVTRPVFAALSVAGLHIAIAGICLILYWLKGRGTKPSKKSAQSNSIPEDLQEAARAKLSENIDETMAPFIAILHEANMKPEEAALRLGVNLTKQVGPMALVALALAAGFLFARRLTAPDKN
jgi:hypothetical protein